MPVLKNSLRKKPAASKPSQHGGETVTEPGGGAPFLGGGAPGPGGGAPGTARQCGRGGL